MTESPKLTAEWCLDAAMRHERTALIYTDCEENARIIERQRLAAEAFRIAAKVLDPKAREKVADFVCVALGGDPNREGERLTAYDAPADAVLAYFKEQGDD